MIWPLFKSFLFFFLVLLPLPFLVPAPDSAKAPFHSSSAVTIKKEVLKNFFKKKKFLQEMIYGLLIYSCWIQKAGRSRVTYHYGNESKIETFFVHITWLHLESPRGSDSTPFTEYGLPPQKTTIFQSLLLSSRFVSQTF